MTKPKIRTSVSICKGDTNSRQICITLVSSGVVYEIPDNSIAVLLATKPDGKKVYNDCSINGNEIIFDVTTQLIASSGDVECQVELSDAEGTILTSPAFVIRVYEKLLDNSVMESINEYKALTAFCTNAENAAVRAENNAEQIEEQLKATGKLLSEKEEAINVLANKTVQASGNANSSAEDAQNFAVSAGEYASEAKDYAERLQLDVTQLSNYVASAQQSAENASAYADVAISNKTASDTSASNAATSERNAKASETAAKQYEESSSEKLNLCIDYADEASEYADRAKNRASEAGDFRDQAEEFQSQTEAFANTAKGYMDAAALSATNAANSATASASSANQALETKNSAVKDITETKENCLSELEQKTTDLLNSIPDDYSQMAETVKYHNDALTDLDTRVSNKMNSIYTSNLGESHITDCQEGDIRNLKMEGRTEQKQYQGTNLACIKFGYEWNQNTSNMHKGMSVSKYRACTDIIEVKDTKSFSVKFTSINPRAMLTVEFDSDGNFLYRKLNVCGSETISGTYETKFVLSDNTNYFAVVFYSNSEDSPTVMNNETFYGFQINEDDLSEYEPYVGGIPSPNPDYPQEIKNVEQINVRVFAKNVLEDNLYKCVYSLGYPNILSGKIMLPYTPSLENLGIGKIVRCKRGVTYTFSVTNANPNAYICISEYKNISNAYNIENKIGGVKGGKDFFVSYTANSDGILLCMIGGKWLDGKTNIHTCTESELLQVEVGNIATEYKPHEEQSFTITPPNPINAIGNYMDICDVESGVWRYALKSFTDSDKTVDVVANVQNYVLPIEVTEPINADDLEKLRALKTYYGNTNIFITDQDGNDITTWFDYHFNLKPYVEYVKEQISDSKELIYDMQARQLDAEVSNAWAYINAVYSASVADFS